MSYPLVTLTATKLLPIFVVFALPLMLVDGVLFLFNQEPIFRLHNNLFRWLAWSLSNRYPAMVWASSIIGTFALFVTCLVFLANPVDLSLLLAVGMVSLTTAVLAIYHYHSMPGALDGMAEVIVAPLTMLHAQLAQVPPAVVADSAQPFIPVDNEQPSPQPFWDRIDKFEPTDGREITCNNFQYASVMFGGVTSPLPMNTVSRYFTGSAPA